MKSLLLSVLLIVSINSLSAQDKPVEFSTFQLSDSVYMLKGRGGNVGISTGEDGLFIIDDQVKPVTAELLKAVRKISNKPIRIVVNTHYHADHVGGNEAIGSAGAVIIAHDNKYPQEDDHRAGQHFHAADHTALCRRCTAIGHIQRPHDAAHEW